MLHLLFFVYTGVVSRPLLFSEKYVFSTSATLPSSCHSTDSTLDCTTCRRIYVSRIPNFKHTWICSAPSENLRNLEIALRILRILRLRNTRAQSRDCVAIYKLSTLPVRLTVSYLLCMCIASQSTNFQPCLYAWQWAIYCACVARRMEDSLDKVSIGGLLRSGRVSNAARRVFQCFETFRAEPYGGVVVHLRDILQL